MVPEVVQLQTVTSFHEGHFIQRQKGTVYLSQFSLTEFTFYAH